MISGRRVLVRWDGCLPGWWEVSVNLLSLTLTGIHEVAQPYTFIYTVFYIITKKCPFELNTSILWRFTSDLLTRSVNNNNKKKKAGVH